MARKLTWVPEFIGFGAMEVTKPYEFIGFGAMDVTKPYEFLGFGAMDVTVAGAQRPKIPEKMKNVAGQSLAPNPMNLKGLVTSMAPNPMNL